eukprot:COSAG02_NODE_17922_length_971_cov_1.286697_2_plen_93_part_00
MLYSIEYTVAVYGVAWGDSESPRPRLRVLYLGTGTPVAGDVGFLRGRDTTVLHSCIPLTRITPQVNSIESIPQIGVIYISFALCSEIHNALP